MLHGGLVLRSWAHNRLVRFWHLSERATSLETWTERENQFFAGTFRAPTDASNLDLTRLKQKLVEGGSPCKISELLPGGRSYATTASFVRKAFKRSFGIR